MAKELLTDLVIRLVALAVFIGVVVGVGRLGQHLAGTPGFAAGLVVGLLVDAGLAAVLIAWRRPDAD